MPAKDKPGSARSTSRRANAELWLTVAFTPALCVAFLAWFGEWRAMGWLLLGLAATVAWCAAVEWLRAPLGFAGGAVLLALWWILCLPLRALAATRDWIFKKKPVRNVGEEPHMGSGPPWMGDRLEREERELPRWEEPLVEVVGSCFWAGLLVSQLAPKPWASMGIALMLPALASAVLWAVITPALGMREWIRGRTVKWHRLAITLLAAWFLYFVWPTPYVYLQHHGVVNRVNRFTGAEQVSGPGGWHRRLTP